MYIYKLDIMITINIYFSVIFNFNFEHYVWFYSIFFILTYEHQIELNVAYFSFSPS